MGGNGRDEWARLAARCFRAFIIANDWTTAKLATHIEVRHDRAEKLRCGRNQPYAYELACLHPDELEMYMATLRRALATGDVPS